MSRLLRDRHLLLLGGCTLLLFGLDLARAYLGTELRPWQWAAGLGFVLALRALLIGHGVHGTRLLCLLALACFLVPTYVDHARRLENGDSYHYYAYLRSLLFDGDLDLRNDYVLLGWADPSHHNVLPVGAPILWSPLVIAVHAVRMLFPGTPNGVEPLYQASICFATLVYGAIGLFLLLDTLERFVGPAAALWTTLLLWIGSPLRFYLSVLPGVAHALEFFAAVLVLRTSLALRDHPDRASAIRAGIACGIVFLTRSQDGLLLFLPACVFGELLLRGPARAATIRAGLTTLGAFALVALPQLAVWQVMFGTPLLIPHKAIHGASFMHLSAPQFAATLFSVEGGLFVSHPVLLIAVLGLPLLLRRDPRYTLAILPILVAGWYVNATVFDWYQIRRFTGLVPLLAPALALIVAPLARAGAPAMALLTLLTLRYDLAVDRLRPDPGSPVPIHAALEEVAFGLARDTYRVLEPLAPRAAVWIATGFSGETLGSEPVSRLEFSGPDGLLRLLESRNLSGVEFEDGQAVRWVRDRDARLFLPIAHAGPFKLTLHARPLEIPEPQALEVEWNGTPLGRQAMPPGFTDYRFQVPADAVSIGTNTLLLKFERGPIFHRVRGSGPREIRPAALEWLTLHRPETP